MLPSATGASTGNAIEPPAIMAVMNAQSRPFTIFMSRYRNSSRTSSTGATIDVPHSLHALAGGWSSRHWTQQNVEECSTPLRVCYKSGRSARSVKIAGMEKW